MDVRKRQDRGHPIPEAPAPWSCNCETYWLVLQLQNPLPADIYDPLEASHSAVSTEGFRGGFGMVMIVRYSHTPVGSYDELLVIPGTFDVSGGSQKGKARRRISRIYVNQRETTYNGRKNWNIPKHLARFEFSAPPVAKGASPPSDLTVSVYPHDAGISDKPFFRATLTPARYLPTFPLDTAWLPLNMTFVQPPIPSSDDSVLCGTDAWRSYKVAGRTRRARVMWTRVEQGEELAEKGYWPLVPLWKLGLWLEDATLDIPKPEEWQE
ncbi:hypothetical protein LTR56_013285 [Elasticomyces elasticus]|nr:hypothetical protein LTR56_013285 [Elasticomyces elasticus]KAK3668419.1 hypothetical protein LTR22_000711 [Elasticomyces elasticus]KAK4930891.1 hypothetical protein LTR49_002657 [Elasticomyces elasticus]KAK5758697.1 hypothetical protein LTS12_011243 [Elasticomyces elasticus]